MFVNKYVVVEETDMQRLQDKVNRLAAEGYYVQSTYGIPNHIRHSHVVWMYKSIEVKEPNG